MQFRSFGLTVEKFQQDQNLATNLIVGTLPVLALISSQLILYFLVGPNTSQAPEVTKSDYMALFERGQRINFLAILFLYVLVAVCVSVRTISNFYYKTSRKKNSLALLLFLLAIGIIYYFLDVRTDNIEAMGISWFQKAFSILPTDSLLNYERFMLIMKLTTILSFIVIALLIWDGIACLEEQPGESDEFSWRLQITRLKENLYMAAVVLVLGMIAFSYYSSYPLIYLQGEIPDAKVLQKAYEGISTSMIAYSGLTFSIMLASYALPVASILSNRADRITATSWKERNSEGNNRVFTRGEFRDLLTKLREKNGMNFSAKDFAQTLIAMIAPLATGAATNLFSVIG